jgi:hypothetical protein
VETHANPLTPGHCSSEGVPNNLFMNADVGQSIEDQNKFMEDNRRTRAHGNQQFLQKITNCPHFTSNWAGKLEDFHKLL